MGNWVEGEIWDFEFSRLKSSFWILGRHFGLITKLWGFEWMISNSISTNIWMTNLIGSKKSVVTTNGGEGGSWFQSEIWEFELSRLNSSIRVLGWNIGPMTKISWWRILGQNIGPIKWKSRIGAIIWMTYVSCSIKLRCFVMGWWGCYWQVIGISPQNDLKVDFANLNCRG